MLEERQFITPPHWEISDITGMLNPVCRFFVVWGVFDTEAKILVGRPGRHIVSMTQQADGTWAFAPPPVRPDNGRPFVFAQDVLDRLTADISGDVARRGVVPGILAPVKNADGTATVTAVHYLLKDGRYVRTLKPCTTPVANPDLSAIADIVPAELLAEARAQINGMK